MAGTRLRLTHFILCTLLAIGVLQGCGGGGGGDSRSAGGSVSGIAVDPYISGAVFQEIAAGSGAPLQESSPSDADGRFVFAKPLTPGSVVQMKAGQQGMHNGMPFASILKRVVDSRGELVVSPLTTLMANGLSPEQTISLLGRAGLPGLTRVDLFADPMVGMSGANAPTGQALLRLQAAMAVNAFFSVADAYAMSASEIVANEDRLADMVAMVESVLNQERFDEAVSAAQGMMNLPAEERCGLYLQASVSVIDEMVKNLEGDATLDPVAEADYLSGAMPELMLFYYAQENRGEQAVEGAIATGTLPDVQEDEVPVILMAKWSESPGKGLGKNKPPVAVAGSDLNVVVGDSVQLDGSASYDPNGDPLTYRWSLTGKPAGSSAVLANPTAVKPSFVADRTGTYQVSLVVNDGTSDSGSSVVTVIAASGNVPPVANAGSSQQVYAGDLVTLNGSASSDADGDPLTYRWSFISRPAGSAAVLSNPAAAAPTFTADLAGNYVLSLVVNDGTVDSGIAQVTVTAVTGNLQPVANAGSGQEVVAGTQVVLDGRGSSDPDGNPLTYKWSIASKPAASSATLSNPSATQPTFTADVAGTYVISLIVNDGQIDSKPANVSITATAPAGTPPTPVYPGTVRLGAATYQVAENAGKVDIVFERVNGSDGPLTVEWRTRTLDGYGTADYATDYGTFLWTAINFAHGETRKTLPITINQDALVEGDEWFTVLLRDPAAATAVTAPTSAVVTIKDDDTATAPAPAPAPTGPLAVFPGAEGFGTHTKAGRGGTIYKVTNLNNSGIGSLRAALEASGPRIVVFEVSGTIALTAPIYVTNPYLTIAGQTAPSPGINVRNYGIMVRTHDILIQHLRFRMGDTYTDIVGPLYMQYYPNKNVVYNIVIDHCSIAWGRDDCISFHYYMTDLTLSNSILSEGLEYDGGRSRGVLVTDRVKNISILKNLIAHHKVRYPEVNIGSQLVHVNNLCYNGGLSSGWVNIVDNLAENPAGEPLKLASENNQFINGPNSVYGQSPYYINSNLASTSQLYITGAAYNGSNPIIANYKGSSVMVNFRPLWHNSIQVLPTTDVYNYVLASAGARPLDRDAVDHRIVNEVKTRTGSWKSSVAQAGGHPVLVQNYRAFNIGSNPNGDDNGNGYTNIEEILHLMAAQIEGR